MRSSALDPSVSDLHVGTPGLHGSGVGPMDASDADAYFDEVFDGLVAELADDLARRGPGPATLRPVLHLIDAAGMFVVTLPVPSLALSEIEVRCADGVLTILGPDLHRSVYLPDPVDAAQRRATLAGGVLTVEVPRVREAL